jgi:N-methylhydantoinase A
LNEEPPAGPRAPQDAALREMRSVFDGARFVATPVYARSALRTGDTFAGPAVIEQYDATTYVAPGWDVRVDTLGNVRMER